MRWLALEAVSSTYTLESDVWSYGVTLWEVFSAGALPYAGKSVCHLYDMAKWDKVARSVRQFVYTSSNVGALLQGPKVISDVISGHRLQQPANCPQVAVQCSIYQRHLFSIALPLIEQLLPPVLPLPLLRISLYGILHGFGAHGIDDVHAQSCYQVMMSCWSAIPAKRPSFTTLSRLIGELFEISTRHHILKAFEAAAKKDLDERYVCGAAVFMRIVQLTILGVHWH